MALKARRGSGEGSVYQRADGRWVAQVDAGHLPSGRRRYSRSTRATKAEAIKALRELQRNVEAGVQLDQNSTVTTYLDWWLDNVLPGTVKASTEDDYRALLGRWVKPHIGHHRLAKLTPAHVQGMLRTLEKQGLSPRSRQYARAVLVRSLKWAVMTGTLPRNPAALVDGPRNAATKLDDSLSAQEARDVLAAAQGNRWEALAVIVLRLGLRRGEALALRWDDVDLKAKELTVNGTLKWRKGGELYIDPPKTESARRTIPLVAGTLDALKGHRRTQAAERLAAGPLWRDSGHVFTRPDGRAVVPNTATVWWRDLTPRAGIGPRRFHASRHTAATLMLEDGVPLEVVSAILGHAGLAITADVYARVTADSKRRALLRLEDVMGGES
jgi:integrase